MLKKNIKEYTNHFYTNYQRLSSKTDRGNQKINNSKVTKF